MGKNILKNLSESVFYELDNKDKHFIPSCKLKSVMNTLFNNFLIILIC